MARIIKGEGRIPNDIMIVGERPGYEEAQSGHNFVGPAGDELWDRLWRIAKLDRDDVFVVNLVRTFSKNPPTDEEINYFSPTLRIDLLRVQPKYIITVGYHAARWFLPQYKGVSGDYFHGVPHHYTYGRLTRRMAVVIPVVHSSAALRQPNLYQNTFSRDVEMVRDVLAGHCVPAVVTRPQPYRIGLASLLSPANQRIGVDTEYNAATRTVECVTLAADQSHAAIVETHDGRTVTPYLKQTILRARNIVSHSAKAEYHAFSWLGMDLDALGVRVDDTMIKAYLLGLPQSLKVLAYRLLGWSMSDYDDLVAPLDNSVVRSSLEAHYESWRRLHVQHAKTLEGFAKRHRKTQGSLKAARAAAVARFGKDPEAEAAEGSTQGEEAQYIPRRILTSIHKLLDTDGGSETRQPLRKRWSDSVFAPYIVLPQAPTWKDVETEKRITYALTDAIAHRAVDDVLDAKIDDQHLRSVYEIDRAVLPWLVRNEQIGLACDEDALHDLSEEFAYDFDRICKKIDKLAGYSVNPLSGPDVSTCLFEELGITPTRKTPKGKHYTTQDKYLKARKHEHTIIPLIIEARQLNKYRGTYTDRLPALLRDGRYHPDWKYTRTATGRLAEEIILLIPKHSDRAHQIRNCFHATHGHVLVSVDLSQIELRAMAHLSGDTRLLRAFANGDDIHAQVAHELLGAPKRKADQDESLHRLPAKTLNFSIINGTTEYGILDQLHEQGQLQWDIDQVRELLTGWFRIHKGVDHYWRVQIAFARRHGYVKDLFGRRRWIAGVLSTSDQVRREAERQCLCPIQATADGISKIWNKRIWKKIIVPRTLAGTYCEPWVRVHDDTTLEVHRKAASDVANQMLALVPNLLCVPTLAEAKTGTRWGELAA